MFLIEASKRSHEFIRKHFIKRKSRSIRLHFNYSLLFFSLPISHIFKQNNSFLLIKKLNKMSAPIVMQITSQSLMKWRQFVETSLFFVPGVRIFANDLTI